MQRPSLAHPDVLIATWFGAGYLPVAPGTWGSLAALPVAWVLQAGGGTAVLAVAVAAIYGAGRWATARYSARVGSEDPGEVVIDEVAGQWLAVVPAGIDPVLFVLGFLLFRVLDVLKPWPIYIIDQKVKGADGVMLDDIAAGALAAVGVAFADVFVFGS